jgi:hypothetical protein
MVQENASAGIRHQIVRRFPPRSRTASGALLGIEVGVYPDVAPENMAFVQLDVADEAQAKAAVDEAT